MPRMTSKSTSSKQTRFAKNILPSKISGHCRHALLVTKLLVEGIVIRPHGGNTAITTSDAQIRSHLYYRNLRRSTTLDKNISAKISKPHTRLSHNILSNKTLPNLTTESFRKQLQPEAKQSKTQKQLWFLNRSSDTT